MEMKTQNCNLKLKTKIKPDIRFLNDMKSVLYDKKWAKTAPNFPVYYMYRRVKVTGGFTHSITVITSQMLGKEFAKTKGHGHLGEVKEIYTVLKGKVIYLFQKCKKNKVLDVYAIKAKRGESVIIPKGYEHITINLSKKGILKEGDWAMENRKNLYNFIEKMKGMCYYYTESGWVKNKNYSLVPKLRFKKPIKKLPKDLSFLL